MSTIIELFVVIGGIWLLAARQSPGWMWSVAIGAYLLVWPFAHAVTPWVMTPAWLLFIPGVVLLCVPAIRRQVIGAPSCTSNVRIEPLSE